MAINKTALREILLQDFSRYLRWSFKTKNNSKFIIKDFHKKVIEALIKVYSGEIKKLSINMPPRSGKTEIVNAFLEWTMTKHPRSKNIMTSYADTLVSNSSQQIRDMFNSFEHKNLFNVETKPDSQSKKLWKTKDNGGLYAVSSFGQITGHGAGSKDLQEWSGCIVVDDPIKPSDANSILKLMKVRDWYETTLSNRKNNPNVPTILIMQRVHSEDLCGCIKRNDFKDLEEWEFVEVQAYDETRQESFWEDYYPVEKLLKMRASNKHYFSSQFQQNPTIKGGNLFKYEWFKWWKIEPVLEYKFITVDTAQKTKEQNDFTVLQCWGVGTDENIYLLDMQRGKYEAPQLRREAKAFYNKHDQDKKSPLRHMHIEDKSSGTSLIQDFLEENLKIRDIQRNTDKVTRANNTTPYIEAGRVFLNEDIEQISDLINEALGFPNEKHDDTLDPLMDAIEIGIIDKNVCFFVLSG